MKPTMRKHPCIAYLTILASVTAVLCGCASRPVVFDWDRPGGPGVEGWIRSPDDDYRPGDPVVILFQCYADAYVTAFVFGPQGEVAQVFPHGYVSTSLRHGGKIAGVPYPDPARPGATLRIPIRVLLISARSDIAWLEGYDVDRAGDYPALRRPSRARQTDFQQHIADILDNLPRHSWSAAWLEFDGSESPES